MPDQIFADPRLAAIYDDIDGDRADLDHYEAIVDKLGARSVLDIGCGTGVLACRLARRGVTMIGLDPAHASLAVARAKAGADPITWLLGHATTLPSVVVDVVTMTDNVAQVFVRDEEWSAALVGVRRVLRDDGRLVCETRDPSFRGWEEWPRDRSLSVSDTVAGGVEHWVELTNVQLPLVSFRHSFRFLDSGDIVTSDSTLRFRDRDEIAASLAAADSPLRTCATRRTGRAESSSSSRDPSPSRDRRAGGPGQLALLSRDGANGATGSGVRGLTVVGRDSPVFALAMGMTSVVSVCGAIPPENSRSCSTATSRAWSRAESATAVGLGSAALFSSRT